MEILNVTAAELRDITSVASQEEQLVFLGFFVNLMRRFGINDPSNPEILKYGLSVLEQFARPKMELPVVPADNISLWVGIHNNQQLICNVLEDGLMLSDITRKKKIAPTVMTVQYNIAAVELYPAYLEAYLQKQVAPANSDSPADQKGYVVLGQEQDTPVVEEDENKA